MADRDSSTFAASTGGTVVGGTYTFNQPGMNVTKDGSIGVNLGFDSGYVRTLHPVLAKGDIIIFKFTPVSAIHLIEISCPWWLRSSNDVASLTGEGIGVRVNHDVPNDNYEFGRCGALTAMTDDDPVTIEAGHSYDIKYICHPVTGILNCYAKDTQDDDYILVCHSDADWSGTEFYACTNPVKGAAGYTIENYRWSPPVDAPTVTIVGGNQSVPGIAAVNIEASLGGGTPDTFLWEKVSGPGTLTFGDDEDETTTVSPSAAGTYVISATAENLGGSDSDEMTIIWGVVGMTRIPNYDSPSGTGFSFLKAGFP